MSRVKRTAEQRRVLRSSTKSGVVGLPATPAPASAEPKRKRRRRRAGADPWTVRRKKPTKSTRRVRRPPPTHFTCRICAEEKPVDTFVKWIPTSRVFKHALAAEVPAPCIAHLARNPRSKNDPVCKDCVGQSMAAKLDTTGARTVSIGCLEPGCSSYWDFSFIIKYFPVEALEKYNLSMLNVWKEQNQIFTCVTESCGHVGLLDPIAAGYPQIECPECKTRICASCKITWHKGFTCAEYAARHVNEKMTDPEKDTLKIMQEKDGKRCPNCYIVIEKDGGCDSMYCMGCRTYFNWATAASAVPGAKPAMIQQQIYGWTGPMTCEIDGLEQGNSTATPAA